ncbi:hypothetical protein LUZ60_000566 [Juncus effusus]|nr:hypothetical protein LUZ60_000566 [Juncus effusus]
MHGDKGCVRIDVTLSPNVVLPVFVRNPKSEGNFALFKFVKDVFEFAKEDKNRVLFPLKVGLAMVVVSLLMLITQPYEVFGSNIVWSILTVAIMFEYTVGATLNRGFNRAVGSLIAAIFAFVVIQITLLIGCKMVPYVIGVSIFLIATVTSFMKLWPSLVPYEHCFRVIVFTYCLTIVSGYRIGNPIDTALTRLYCIAIGAIVAVVVNVFVFPIWAGEQLHKEIVSSFYDVADSLEGCVKNYLIKDDVSEHDESSLQKCQAVLNSSLRIDSLANSAKWEPPHGVFSRPFFYTWSHYVKVASTLRHCAYEITALHGCLRSDIQPPFNLRKAFQPEILDVESRAAELIRHLGNSITLMKHTPIQTIHILKSLHTSIHNLQKSIDFQFSSLTLKNYYYDSYIDNLGGKQRKRRIQSWPSDESESDGEINLDILGRVKTLEGVATLSFFNFVLLLIEFVARLDGLVDAVDELSKLAKFKEELV